MTERPGFHEWREEQYAPIAASDSSPVLPLGPIIGDFDGDGAPDVVFNGLDQHIELVPVVLSNKGEPRVVNVTEGPELVAPTQLRLTRLAVATVTWDGARRNGVDFITWAKDGRTVQGHAVYIWIDGHFARLIDGE